MRRAAGSVVFVLAFGLAANLAANLGVNLVAGVAARGGEAGPPEAWTPSPPERVTEGSAPWLSPTGTRLVFTRYLLDPGTRDERGQPVVAGLLHVRELAAGTERRVPRSGWVVSGWAGDDLVVLDDGTSVRVGGTGEEPAFPTTPEGLWATASGRSRDGRRFAYVHRADFEKALGSPGGKVAPVALQVLESGRPPRALTVGDGPDMSGTRGLLAFSPDGRTLAFHLSFNHWGQPPHPRVGVVALETGASAFVLDEPYGSVGAADAGEWQSGVSGAQAWDGKGERFAFVRTTGNTRRDLYVCSADGKDLRRLTSDGGWKASPCLSPEGDRCAYWVREPRPGAPGTPEAPTVLRVLFLRTGGVVDLPGPGEGTGSGLQWSPAGLSLWFAWRGGDERTSIWRALAPPSPGVPAGTPVVDLRGSPVDELVESLRSEDHDEVEAAIHRARETDDPRVTRALLDVLHRWAREEDLPRPYDLIEALRARGAVAAIPDLLHWLGSGEWADAVSPPLVEWRVEAAVPLWRRIVAAGPPSSRGTAAAALAGMGAPDGWAAVEQVLAAPDEDARWLLCRMLGEVRDARAVDLLIRLVGDRTGLYSESPDKMREVGDEAAAALVRLTGRSFGRDEAAWRKWWEGSGRRLPAPPRPATGGGGDDDEGGDR